MPQWALYHYRVNTAKTEQQIELVAVVAVGDAVEAAVVAVAAVEAAVAAAVGHCLDPRWLLGFEIRI